MDETVKVKIRDVYFSYQAREVLRGVSADFKENSITAIVGPSGVGKSTLLTTMNRLWESVPGAAMKGTVKIKFNGSFHEISSPSYPLPQLRRQVGMVFQVPNSLPMSIYKNVAFPLKLAGRKDSEETRRGVERALSQAYLWEEVKDRLNEDALSLSVGQQQRLCIARALVLEPEVLLMDEPTSSLDSTAASVIEGLLLNLRERLTIIVVSHYLDQVRRIADRVVELSESGALSIDDGKGGENN
jgi:phosphate transport system ATP-binding protein